MIDAAAFAALLAVLAVITVMESVVVRPPRLLVLLRIAALPLFGLEIVVLASRLSHFT